MRHTIFAIALFVSATSTAVHSQDLMSAFPEINGCERKVYPLERSGTGFSQSAYYTGSQAFCGSITIMVAPGLLATRRTEMDSVLSRRFKVRGFDAWYTTPLCGTPPTGGDSVDVYFATDAVLMVNGETADREGILTYPERADYRLLRRVVNRAKATAKL